MRSPHRWNKAEADRLHQYGYPTSTPDAPKAPDPVFFHTGGMMEVYGPIYRAGWYFWDEGWFLHGSYASEDAARAALDEYVREELG